jgi:hypothetical protein
VSRLAAQACSPGLDACLDRDDRDDERDGGVGPPEAEEGVGAEADEDRERVVSPENEKVSHAGTSLKPSDGLEPLTPSL